MARRVLDNEIVQLLIGNAILLVGLGAIASIITALGLAELAPFIGLGIAALIIFGAQP